MKDLKPLVKRFLGEAVETPHIFRKGELPAYDKAKAELASGLKRNLLKWVKGQGFSGGRTYISLHAVRYHDGGCGLYCVAVISFPSKDGKRKTNRMNVTIMPDYAVTDFSVYDNVMVMEPMPSKMLAAIQEWLGPVNMKKEEVEQACQPI